jgi:hypothetical protein
MSSISVKFQGVAHTIDFIQTEPVMAFKARLALVTALPVENMKLGNLRVILNFNRCK